MAILNIYVSPTIVWGVFSRNCKRSWNHSMSESLPSEEVGPSKSLVPQWKFCLRPRSHIELPGFYYHSLSNNFSWRSPMQLWANRPESILFPLWQRLNLKEILPLVKTWKWRRNLTIMPITLVLSFLGRPVFWIISYQQSKFLLFNFLKIIRLVWFKQI